jgi:predicted transcriptional regulator
LKEVSNIPIQFNTNPRRQGKPQKLPELELEETVTDASQLNPIPSTPSKRSSPAKSVRFAKPAVDENGEEEIGTASPSIKKESTPFPASQVALLDVDEQDEAEGGVASPLMKTESTPIRATQASIGQSVKIEIEDSDEGSDAEMEEGEPDETTTAEASEEIHPETCYGEFGAETQIEAERLLESPVLSGNVAATQTEGDVTGETVEEKTQGMTQVMESQRLSARHVDAMAPRTIDSDIFISIHPQHVTNIVNRKKNHEFRNWDFKESVVRIWIYETFPVQTLKYMAEVGPAKRPGEIKDERGLGNAEFNAKIGPAHRAYEILRLYELADPIPLSKLKSNEWFKAPPQKFSWVRPAVLGELMGNLKPPLFDNTELDEPVESSTDTQEAEAQLLSNIHQFTQPAPGSDHPSSPILKARTGVHEPVASIQQKTPQNTSNFPPPFSQASTVDLSQTQTPRHQCLADIIWESPTRPIPSSTPMKLPRSDGPEHHGSESLAPFSMASSQLLTRSQMLSDGLLHESIPGPPPIIMDSDEDDD